ncbi:putative protein TIF31 [Paratrimastix pyriformis]|uniref:Clu domain-containing protein n=1 Tax=Paratrimastix pyriformis TaxID=342808 RepID=A0ABQ8UJD3_9EUKA|nr:putative protein TIF31 [Paratrimastix pyriformis]
MGCGASSANKTSRLPVVEPVSASEAVATTTTTVSSTTITTTTTTTTTTSITNPTVSSTGDSLTTNIPPAVDLPADTHTSVGQTTGANPPPPDVEDATAVRPIDHSAVEPPLTERPAIARPRIGRTGSSQPLSESSTMDTRQPPAVDIPYQPDKPRSTTPDARQPTTPRGPTPTVEAPNPATPTAAPASAVFENAPAVAIPPGTINPQTGPTKQQPDEAAAVDITPSSPVVLPQSLTPQPTTPRVDAASPSTPRSSAAAGGMSMLPASPRTPSSPRSGATTPRQQSFVGPTSAAGGAPASWGPRADSPLQPQVKSAPTAGGLVSMGPAPPASPIPGASSIMAPLPLPSINPAPPSPHAPAVLSGPSVATLPLPSTMAPAVSISPRVDIAAAAAAAVAEEEAARRKKAEEERMEQERISRQLTAETAAAEQRRLREALEAAAARDADLKQKMEREALARTQSHSLRLTELEWDHTGTLGLTLDQVMARVQFVVENTFICNGGRVLHQHVGLPMGTNCAPELANLYCYAIESLFMDGAAQLPTPDQYGLQYAPTSADSRKCTFLGMNVELTLSGSLRLDAISVCLFKHSTAPNRGVFTSQLVRYVTICNNFHDFKEATQKLTTRMVERGHSIRLMARAWNTFIRCRWEANQLGAGKLRGWFRCLCRWLVAQRSEARVPYGAEDTGPPPKPPSEERLGPAEDVSQDRLSQVKDASRLVALCDEALRQTEHAEPEASPETPIDPTICPARERQETLERERMQREESKSQEREAREQERARLVQLQREMAEQDRRAIEAKKREEEALARDLENLANPELVSVKVIFPNDDIREVYRYHFVPHRATVKELKNMVQKEFGYAVAQQRFFYKHKEEKNMVQKEFGYAVAQQRFFYKHKEMWPICAAKMCCQYVLPRCAAKMCCQDVAKMCCQDVLPRCAAKMCCQDVLPRCAANMCCQDVLPRCAAKMCCQDVLPRCAAKMCCQDVLPICAANMCCQYVLPICAANMCCQDVLPRCAAKMCCQDVLPRCAAKMCCQDVLPRCAAKMCCQDVLPRCAAKMCCQYVLPRCAAKMCCQDVLPRCGQDVLPRCAANMCCQDVLPICAAKMWPICAAKMWPICAAKMCCQDVLPRCAANMCCQDVLPICAAKMCCQDVAKMCCQDVLPRCAAKMCNMCWQYGIFDDQVLTALPKFDPKQAYLRFYPSSPPTEPVAEDVYRPLIREASLDALRQTTAYQGAAPEGAPPVRDWLAEQMAIESQPQPTAQEQLAADKAKLQLMAAFTDCAKLGAALILQGQIKPTTTIPELYGHDGERHIVGGILFRRVAGWEILHEDIGEGDVAFKVAAHEVRACALIAKAKIPGLCVPLCCLVDAYGIRFLCHAIAPLDLNTLAYGSGNDALIIQQHPDAAPYAQQIGSLFNLAPHPVLERLSAAPVSLYTPVSLELHRNINYKDGDTMPRYFVLNAGRCFAPDIPTASDTELDGVDAISRVLRQEMTGLYAAGEQLMSGWVMYTSTEPHTCAQCGKMIIDYEYYTYEKKRYELCLSCFETCNHEALPYPVQRLVKKSIPFSQRETYWRHETTGERVDTKPLQITPLNPDAFYTRDEAGTTALRGCSRYVLETVVPRFIEELEELECTPLTPEDLTEEMHRRGINMRYLGRIAGTRLSHLRQLCVREILARTIKVLIRDGLFFMNEERPNYTEDDAKAVIVHYLNEIFTPVPTEESNTMWRYIEELAQKKFGYALEQGVRAKIYLVALLRSICAKIGVTLARFKGFDFAQAVPLAVPHAALSRFIVQLG